MKINNRILAMSLCLSPLIAGLPAAAKTALPSAFCSDAMLANSGSAASVRRVYDAFALALNKQLTKKTSDTNLIVSPVSIHLAMSMALAGAEGKTVEGLVRALSLPRSTVKSLDRRWFVRQTPVLARLICPDTNETHTLRVANTMFAQAGKVFAPPFLKRLDQAFSARPQTVDYAKNPEQARLTINKWVEERTQDKITELLAKGTVDASTRLTLVNALYLKAAWEQPFEVEMTRSKPFHLSAAQQIKVPMMEREGTQHDYAYAKLAHAEAVRLDLAGARLTMTIILPAESGSLAATEQALTVKELTDLDLALARRKVNLSMPKFRSVGTFRLASVLKKLGAVAAFSPKKADFKGIDGGKDRLFISEVAHKTFVDVHELGLEAAAATATTMKAGGMPVAPQEPVTVVIDRPFLFIVRSKPDGVPIIWGRIVDPRSAGG